MPHLINSRARCLCWPSAQARTLLLQPTPSRHCNRTAQRAKNTRMAKHEAKPVAASAATVVSMVVVLTCARTALSIVAGNVPRSVAQLAGPSSVVIHYYTLTLSYIPLVLWPCACLPSIKLCMTCTCFMHTPSLDHWCLQPQSNIQPLSYVHTPHPSK
jgi:hypothetical protein